MMLACRGKGIGYIVLVGHVALYRQPADIIGNPFDRAKIKIEKRHTGTGCGQTADNRRAETGASAGYHRCLSVHVHARSPPRCVRQAA